MSTLAATHPQRENTKRLEELIRTLLGLLITAWSPRSWFRRMSYVILRHSFLRRLH